MSEAQMATADERPDMLPATLPTINEEDGLLALAIQNKVDTEALEKLMALKERHEANEARKAYFVAMTAFKTAAPAVLDKDANVDFTGKSGVRTHYKHTTLANACTKLTPLLCRFGLTPTWACEQDYNASLVTVTCRITHELGHSEETTLTGPYDTSGNKNPIQAIGSAVSYLERYTFLSATGMATADMDDDGIGSGPRRSEPEAERPKPKPAAASKPASAPAPAPPDGGDALRDAKIGFGTHKAKTWRKVEYSWLEWVRDNIDPAKDGYAKAKHGAAVAELAARAAVAELAARAADGHSELPAFPAGFGPDLPLPAGYEHAGEKLCEVPTAYLERMNEKGKGKCVKVAIAELARRAEQGISIAEPENDDGGDLPERTVEATCHHCQSTNTTTELCTPGWMKCRDCGQHTAVDDGGDLPDDQIPF